MRKLIVCFLVAALGLALDSCNKPEPVSIAEEGTVYFPQAYGTRSTLTVYLIDSAQTYYFGAAYGGLKNPSQDISVSFALDTTLISTYNAAHGTNYLPLPDKSYKLSGLSVVIKAGQTGSSALTLSVLAKQLNSGTKYMLPVKMSSISSGKLDSTLETAYFMIDSIYTRKQDITGQGTLTVSDENDGGASAAEGSPHLVDNDITTKFLSQNYNPNFWFQLQFPTAQVVNEYTFTSGNDAAARDPKNWTLQGSNDGTTWTILDTRTDAAFSDRELTVTYTFDNNTPYTMYRVNVTANNGDDLFQMSEWRMIQYY